MSKQTIGFIGTGVMGFSMAGHLIGAGHPLNVHNRTPDRADPLIERGATWFDDPGIRKILRQHPVIGKHEKTAAWFTPAMGCNRADCAITKRLGEAHEFHCRSGEVIYDFRSGTVCYPER